VLVGYSDSSKESGICASRFATWRAQGEIANALRAHQERHVIFHGRGGSIARGGGRIDSLVRTTPAAAVNGVLRLTEQGEVINQSYGLRPIAMRTLERAFSTLTLATSDAAQGRLPPERPEHIEAGATVAAASREAYRRLVYGDRAFYEYFEAVTPIDVIGRMQIGSRPASRPGREGLEALRAVPWVFAWTQTRNLLPAWYGAGTGLEVAIERHGFDTVRQAVASWHFLGNLLDDLEASLARADLEIAASYNTLAFAPLQRFFADIRQEHARAVRHVLALRGATELLDSDPTLQRSIQLRNPYVDPMNFLQIDLLKRWRASGREDRALFDTLVATIGGIAQGLQSTG
jgi:phosphoenolpyruvate carboxylase